MTAVATKSHVRVGPVQAARHGLVITKRNVLRNFRLPQLLFFSTVQPVMFLLLFTYVFGGAIATPAGEYIDWLLPGILVQSALFGAAATSLGLTEDLASGVIDRFRSLPMARSAVLTGRTAADVMRNGFVLTLMVIVGTIIGFRPAENNWAAVVAAILLALLFGYSMSWVMASIGLAVKSPEAAQTAGFLPLFPLIFASSVFVPVETMPTWLQGFAENQPVTVFTNTIRGLVLDMPIGDDLWKSLAWTAAILIVFIPVSVRLYRRAVI